jgi:acyl-CoA reductase-like NAD-dependent aldehyde dehydrogenase
MATYTVPLYINGKQVQSSTTYDITSPSTGEVLHKASSASIADAISAVEAAQAAFKSWVAVPPAQKAAIFLKAADIVDRRTEELGKYEQDEAGATVGYSSGFDVPTAAAGLRDVAGRIATIVGTFPATSDPSRSALILQEPYGVILGIAPW